MDKPASFTPQRVDVPVRNDSLMNGHIAECTWTHPLYECPKCLRERLQEK